MFALQPLPTAAYILRGSGQPKAPTVARSTSPQLANMIVRFVATHDDVPPAAATFSAITNHLILKKLSLLTKHFCFHDGQLISYDSFTVSPATLP